MRRFSSRYGRLLAAIALVAALLVAWATMRPPTRTAAVLVADVAAGQPIDASAIAVKALGLAGVPDNCVGSLEDARGRVAAVDLPAGTVLSHSLLLGAQRPFTPLPGQVLVPVEVTDPVTWELARTGDMVRVLLPANGAFPGEPAGSRSPVVLAERATVIGRLDQNEASSRGGMFSDLGTNSTSGLSTGRFLLLSVDEYAASMIVSRRGEGRPALLLLGPDSSLD